MSTPRPWLASGDASERAALIVGGRSIGRAELTARADALAGGNTQQHVRCAPIAQNGVGARARSGVRGLELGQHAAAAEGAIRSLRGRLDLRCDARVPRVNEDGGEHHQSDGRHRRYRDPADEWRHHQEAARATGDQRQLEERLEGLGQEDHPAPVDPVDLGGLGAEAVVDRHALVKQFPSVPAHPEQPDLAARLFASPGVADEIGLTRVIVPALW